jgi:hypothetical protein
MLFYAFYHHVAENEEVFLVYFLVAIYLALGSFVGGAYAWKFFEEPILGKFSFNKKGITFYTPIRTITFLYDECAEIGFAQWIGGGGRIFYIYFSKCPITYKQRAVLFYRRSKKKRGKLNLPLYQSEFVLFQYRPDVFEELIECVPERFRDRLIREEAHLNLKPWEKVLHR